MKTMYHIMTFIIGLVCSVCSLVSLLWIILSDHQINGKILAFMFLSLFTAISLIGLRLDYIYNYGIKNE